MVSFIWTTVFLCVGDIVQLGSTTVFRFNHPREAAEMKDCPDEASPL